MSTGDSNKYCKYCISLKDEDLTLNLSMQAISLAGLTLLCIPNVLDGDQLSTDIDAIMQAIKEHTPKKILAIVTPTSCFAPRAADRLIEVH